MERPAFQFLIGFSTTKPTPPATTEEQKPTFQFLIGFSTTPHHRCGRKSQKLRTVSIPYRVQYNCVTLTQDQVH